MPNEHNSLPLFPLPNVVLFPGMSLPLHIFEEKYKKMISNCLESNKQFGIVYTKGKMCAEIGTIAEIIDVEKLNDGRMNILTEGKRRFKILKILTEEPYHEASVQELIDEEIQIDKNLKKLIKEIKTLSSRALKLFDKIFNDKISKKLKLPDEPNELLFLVSANLTCPHESKQEILETKSITDRINKVFPLLKSEIERLEVLLENKETKDEVIKNGKLDVS